MNVTMDLITALTLQLVRTFLAPTYAPAMLVTLVMVLNARLPVVPQLHTVFYRFQDDINVSPALLDIPQRIHQVSTYYNANVRVPI